MTSNDPAATPPALAPAPDRPGAPPQSPEWVPIFGRVIKGVVCYLNPETLQIRITKRWHGAKVTETVNLAPYIRRPDPASD